MEQIELTKANSGEIAARVALILRAGGVVLYPTDTLYGLGADALSDEAVGKIYAIKGRDDGKPIHAIVSDIAMAEKYAEVPEIAKLLVEKFGGKITLIVRKQQHLNTGIFRNISTFGFRIPDNQFCIALSRAFGAPISATSANVAGEEPQRSVEQIVKQLGHGKNHSSILPARRSLGAGGQKAAIEVVVDAGELLPSRPSTVVDLSGNEPKVLREGAISAVDVRSFLSQSEPI